MSLPAPFHESGAHIAIDLRGARALFTTRRDGVSDGPFSSLNLGLNVPPDGGDADERANVARNRERLAAHTGLPATRFAHSHQVHGHTVARITKAPDAHWAQALPTDHQADGQATALHRVATVALAADCLPVALAADNAVAMLHAGWRGLAAGVLAEGVRALRELGATGDVVAAIGPGAGPCCYEVGEEIHARFAHHGPTVRQNAHIDLKQVAALELRGAGVAHIHDVGLCTLCRPELFFSHRRDGARTGRQGGVAWLV